MRIRRLLRKLEALKSLDPVAGALSGAVTRLTGPTPVRNALNGAWLGHPLHPLLTDLPIGAWVSAAVLDVASGKRSAPGADALVAVGIAAAVPTVVTGAADLAEFKDPRAQRVGVVHAAANSVGVACYVASLVARRRGQRALGAALSFTGLGAVAAGGYLGGHLAYGLGSGVDHSTFEEEPGDWHDVAATRTLADGRPHRGRVGNVDVVVVQYDGQLDALADRCSHMGGPLHQGQVEDGCIRCPWHGSTFRLRDGAVVRSPATAPQPHFDTRVRDGRVQARRSHRPKQA